MDATFNDENIELSIESDEIDNEIARWKEDKKRINYKLKILRKRRRRWSKIDLGLPQTVLIQKYYSQNIFNINHNSQYSIFTL